MKKFMTVLLTVLLLWSVCAQAQGVLVSAPAEQTTNAGAKDSVIVQDMYEYMDNLMSFEGIGVNKKTGQMSRKFSGSADAYDLVQEYVRTVCAGEYNLALAGEYSQSYDDESFFSYAMEYTGSARVGGEKIEMNFTDGVYGHVTIWGTIRRNRCEGYITITNGLEFGDLGLRAGGGAVSTALPGESVYADLYRLDNGSYQTGDGRFCVRVGEAMVYSDGQPYTTQASLVRNEGKNREEVRIYNFYRNDSILLTLPYNSVLTGDVLEQRAIGIDRNGGYEEYIDGMEDFLGWKFSGKMLCVCHDGDYLFCYSDDQNDFDQAAVRIMYWDPAEDVAVFYIYASFDSKPYEYEAVAAVSMGGTPRGAEADEVLAMKAGQEMEIKFNGVEFMPSYEIFTWEIVEGSNLIELQNTRSRACTVKAYDPGTVRLRVTYEYGEEGNNILTGNAETEFKSKSREYVIRISP